MLSELVVVDLRGSFVCLGRLEQFDDAWLELRNADLHDLRDSDTTRENYVVAAKLSGIRRNRKRVLVLRSEVVAVSRLADVSAD